MTIRDLWNLIPLAAVFFALSAKADTSYFAANESGGDIPEATAPKQENFGRFVKMSKAAFEADSTMTAQFRNYGQYVSSLRKHRPDRGNSGDPMGRGHGPAGGGNGGGTGGSHPRGGNGHNGGGGTGAGPTT